MVLVDTSVWVEHFQGKGSTLAGLLNETLVLVHPFVLGELACGNLRNRALILQDLGALSGALIATHEETLKLVEDCKLWGSGIGWIDAHLLASALLSHCELWTLDLRLKQAAAGAGVKRFA